MSNYFERIRTLRLRGNTELAQMYIAESNKMRAYAQVLRDAYGIVPPRLFKTMPDGTQIEVTFVGGQDIVNIVAPFIGVKPSEQKIYILSLGGYDTGDANPVKLLDLNGGEIWDTSISDVGFEGDWYQGERWVQCYGAKVLSDNGKVFFANGLLDAGSNYPAIVKEVRKNDWTTTLIKSGTSVYETQKMVADSNYLYIIGTCYNNVDYSSQPWLAKISKSDGSVIWLNTWVGGTCDGWWSDFGTSIGVSDKGIFIGVKKYISTGCQEKCYIQKHSIDDGSFISEVYLGSYSIDGSYHWINDLVVKDGFIYTGEFDYVSNGDTMYWRCRKITSDSLSIVWDTPLTYSGWENPQTESLTVDKSNVYLCGGVYPGGYLSNGGWRIEAIKTSDGSSLWSIAEGIVDPLVWDSALKEAHAITTHDDLNYIWVAGFKTISGGGPNAILEKRAKFDGSLVWQKDYTDIYNGTYLTMEQIIRR